MDVQKREDRLLDQISLLIRNRDAALDWISTYVSTGVLDEETGNWLTSVLKSTETPDGDS